MPVNHMPAEELEPVSIRRNAQRCQTLRKSRMAQKETEYIISRDSGGRVIRIIIME